MHGEVVSSNIAFDKIKRRTIEEQKLNWFINQKSSGRGFREVGKQPKIIYSGKRNPDREGKWEAFWRKYENPHVADVLKY